MECWWSVLMECWSVVYYYYIQAVGMHHFHPIWDRVASGTCLQKLNLLNKKRFSDRRDCWPRLVFCWSISITIEQNRSNTRSALLLLHSGIDSRISWKKENVMECWSRPSTTTWFMIIWSIHDFIHLRLITSMIDYIHYSTAFLRRGGPPYSFWPSPVCLE